MILTTQMQITIPATPTFNFKRTAISHGWYDLPPFELKQESWTLTRVIDLGKAAPLTVEIRGAGKVLNVTLPRAVGRRAIDKITRDVRHMLRLDDDLTHFYQAVAGDPDFSWIAGSGAGRLLRSPTVFEDLVKMICTTNCSWALTDKMINELVNALGRKSNDDRRAFHHRKQWHRRRKSSIATQCAPVIERHILRNSPSASRAETLMLKAGSPASCPPTSLSAR